MKTVWSLATIVCLAGSAWAQSESRSAAIERIAFGSCLHQDKPQPIWDAVAAVEPQVFLMIGDAVYADTTDPEELHRFYSQVDQNPAWKKLRKDCRVLMTWDDHDYGLNDGGAEHPNR
ncbi:MAG: hypothetical protein AAGJ38_09410 [Planctomycetota bacterium]